MQVKQGIVFNVSSACKDSEAAVFCFSIKKGQASERKGEKKKKWETNGLDD
jgi:hypothetical protein